MHTTQTEHKIHTYEHNTEIDPQWATVLIYKELRNQTLSVDARTNTLTVAGLFLCCCSDPGAKHLANTCNQRSRLVCLPKCSMCPLSMQVEHVAQAIPIMYTQ